MHNLTERRISMVRYLVFLFIPILSIYVVRAIATQQVVSFTGNLIGVILLFVLMRQLQVKKHIDLMIHITGGYFTLFVISLIYYGEGSFIWVFIGPPLALLCLGTRSGLFIGIIPIPLLVAGLAYPERFSIANSAETIVPDLIAAYIIVLITSAIFSRVLEQGEKAAIKASSRIQKLESILSMCMHCNKIRMGDKWHEIEDYVARENQVSHGLCAPCAHEHYGDILTE